MEPTDAPTIRNAESDSEMEGDAPDLDLPVVSGYSGTLLEAIRDKVVPHPGPMPFNTFQVWRRDHGKRPTKRLDGHSTAPATEAALWAEVMQALHGENWRNLAKSSSGTVQGRTAAVPPVTAKSSGAASSVSARSSGLTTPPRR